MKLSKICWRLEEGRFCRTLQWLLPTHVSIFAIFFYVYSKVVKRVHEIEFFILALLETWRIHSQSTLNSEYNQSNASFFKNYFLLYMKGGLPRPIHSIWHQPNSIPPANFIYSFSMSQLWIYSFSADLTLSQNKKSYVRKLKKKKKVNQNSVVL